MKSKYYLFVFFSFLLMFYCGKSDQTYTIEIKDGVKHIHNHAPLWGDTLKVALEFIRQIGDLDSEDEDYQFFRPQDIAIDDDENIYILELGNSRIKKFDRDLLFIKSFGRQGQGPGELNFPQSIKFGLDGLLYVNNEFNNRIEVFDTEGNYVDSFRPISSMQEFELLKSGYIVFKKPTLNLVPSEYWEQVENLPLLSIVDRSGNVLQTFGERRKYDEINMRVYGNDCEIAVDNDDNIYITMRKQNRIEKFSLSGDLLFRVDRELPYGESIAHEVVEYEKNGQMRRQSKVNEFSTGIQIDNKGRIWVMTYERQYETGELNFDNMLNIPNVMMLEVFDQNGILLTRIAPDILPYSMLRLIHKNRLYLIDPGFKMCVYEYKIVEK